MEEQTLKTPEITKIAAICFVTRDLDELVEEYARAFGMGPWRLEHGAGRDRVTGEAAAWRRAVCHLPDLDWVIVQPAPGDAALGADLARFGAGLHHITVETARPLEQLERDGTVPLGAVLRRIHQPDGTVRLLTDHMQTLGARLEFVQRPKWYIPPEPDGIYPAQGEPMFTRVRQLAFCVEDRWKTIREWYDGFGVGPWTFHIQDRDSAENVINFGKAIEIDNVANVCIDLNVDLEILQPNRPVDNVYDMLRERGPGLHHICLETSIPYDRARERMTQAGHPATRTCVMDGVERVAHTDHRRTFGCYFELVHRDKDFVPPIHEMYPPWAKPTKPTSLKKIF